MLGVRAVCACLKRRASEARARRVAVNELPRGRVDCERPGDCFCEGRRYTCQSCLRFVPECFGAADEYGDVCDDCAVLIEARTREILRKADTEPPAPLSPLVELLMGLDCRHQAELDHHPLSGSEPKEQP